MKAQYFRIFRWHVLRHLARHPLLGLLNILSVALGVAVYLATQIANHSANRAFAATVDLVAGKAELQITPAPSHGNVWLKVAGRDRHSQLRRSCVACSFAGFTGELEVWASIFTPLLLEFASDKFDAPVRHQRAGPTDPSPSGSVVGDTI